MSVRVVITEGPLGEAAAPRPGGAGAVLRFEGVVRPTEDGREIEGIGYEAYRPMAERELERLAGEVRDRFGLLLLEVEHSEGFVPSGAVSLRVTIAAPHRKATLEAMDRFIDLLKRDVPIWKRPRPPGASE